MLQIMELGYKADQGSRVTLMLLALFSAQTTILGGYAVSDVYIRPQASMVTEMLRHWPIR